MIKVDKRKGKYRINKDGVYLTLTYEEIDKIVEKAGVLIWQHWISR